MSADAARFSSDPRNRRAADKLHRLGPRLILELLADIAADLDAADIIAGRLALYASGNPAALGALGADRIVPFPIRRVTP